eukprot:130026-Chlamydomonas_euryale.AAC.3
MLLRMGGCPCLHKAQQAQYGITLCEPRCVNPTVQTTLNRASGVPTAGKVCVQSSCRQPLAVQPGSAVHTRACPTPLPLAPQTGSAAPPHPFLPHTPPFDPAGRQRRAFTPAPAAHPAF